MLIAPNNKTFTDFEDGSGVGYTVSQAFRDAVKTLDKDVSSSPSKSAARMWSEPLGPDRRGLKF